MTMEWEIASEGCCTIGPVLSLFDSRFGSHLLLSAVLKQTRRCYRSPSLELDLQCIITIEMVGMWSARSY